MTKREARKKYRDMRDALSDAEMQRMLNLMLIQFQKLQLPPVQWVHTYMAMEEAHEIETSMLLQYMEFRNPGLRFCVPVTDFEKNELRNIEWNWDTLLVRNRFGIPEPMFGEAVDPQWIDLAFVPLLAFDKKGYRVGYGKGFYDRFLDSCSADIIKIGLSYFPPVEEISDTQYFDIPLDYCITPDRIYEFG